MSAVFVARKALVVLGVRYDRGQRVDMERLPPVLRRRLVEYKRVVPRAGDAVAAGPATTIVTCAPKVARCGDFGGKKGDGTPCGWIVKDSRPCRFHRTN